MLSNKFFTVYVFLFLTATSTASLLSSWLGYNLSEALSFRLSDGWCQPETQGIGTHCFSDYYYPLFLSESQNPWSGSPNPYPPLALYVYKFFSFAEIYTSSRFALILYLTLLVAAISIPAAHSIFRIKLRGTKLYTVLMITFGSAPILSTIDRGNSAIVLYPALYFWILAIRKSDWNVVLSITTLCILIRPQFAILLLIFIFLGEYKKFLIGLLTSISTLLLSFLLYPNSIIDNFGDWVQQIIGYQAYGINSIFPVNVSFLNTVRLTLQVLNLDESGLIGKSSMSTILFVGVPFIGFLLIGWKFRFYTSLNSKIVSCLIAPLVFVSTTFHYYLFLISLVVIADLLIKEQFLEQNSTSTKVNKIGLKIKYVLLFSTLIPWGLPWRIVPGIRSDQEWAVIGIQWSFAQVTLTFFACHMFFVKPLSDYRHRANQALA